MKYVVEIYLEDVFGFKIAREEEKFGRGLLAVRERAGDEEKFYRAVYEQALRHGLSYLAAHLRRRNLPYIVEPIYAGEEGGRIVGVRIVSYAAVPATVVEEILDVLQLGIGKYLELLAPP